MCDHAKPTEDFVRTDIYNDDKHSSDAAWQMCVSVDQTCMNVNTAKIAVMLNHLGLESNSLSSIYNSLLVGLGSNDSSPFPAGPLASSKSGSWQALNTHFQQGRLPACAGLVRPSPHEERCLLSPVSKSKHAQVLDTIYLLTIAGV